MIFFIHSLNSFLDSMQKNYSSFITMMQWLQLKIVRRIHLWVIHSFPQYSMSLLVSCILYRCVVNNMKYLPKISLNPLSTKKYVFLLAPTVGYLRFIVHSLTLEDWFHSSAEREKFLCAHLKCVSKVPTSMIQLTQVLYGNLKVSSALRMDFKVK